MSGFFTIIRVEEVPTSPELVAKLEADFALGAGVVYVIKDDEVRFAVFPSKPKCLTPTSPLA